MAEQKSNRGVLTTPVFNGNTAMVLRIVVTSLMAGILAVVGWVFLEVRDLPSVYAEKVVVDRTIEGIHKETDSKIADLKKDIKERFDRIEVSQRDTNTKLDKIYYLLGRSAIHDKLEPR